MYSKYLKYIPEELLQKILIAAQVQPFMLKSFPTNKISHFILENEPGLLTSFENKARISECKNLTMLGINCSIPTESWSLVNFRNLIDLRISNNQGPEVVFAINHSVGLRKLTLESVELIRFFEAEKIRWPTSLTKLSLIDTKYVELPNNCPNVQFLSIQDCTAITGLQALLYSLKHLVHLSIDDEEYSQQTLYCLAKGFNCSLKKLKISHCNEVTLEAVSIACTNLTSLSISKSIILSNRCLIPFVDRVKNGLPPLQKLCLSGCNALDHRFLELVPDLKLVDLRITDCHSVTNETLNNIPLSPTIRVFQLCCAIQVTTSAVQKLLSNLPSVESLFLRELGSISAILILKHSLDVCKKLNMIDLSKRYDSCPLEILTNYIPERPLTIRLYGIKLCPLVLRRFLIQFPELTIESKQVRALTQMLEKSGALQGTERINNITERTKRMRLHF
eukprot:TRINITY_DN3405_c0_g2_i2.p1 TRINITY_DN3405_c0_g2~~TRINITY_DN3405_c0_g2_i2.p1  ORF type:complete len:449 (-),score=21.32 TRINITY_DN3405_c0_g2_i2:97-1443(-)